MFNKTIADSRTGSKTPLLQYYSYSTCDPNRTRTTSTPAPKTVADEVKALAAELVVPTKPLRTVVIPLAPYVMPKKGINPAQYDQYLCRDSSLPGNSCAAAAVNADLCANPAISVACKRTCASCPPVTAQQMGALYEGFLVDLLLEIDRRQRLVAGKSISFMLYESIPINGAQAWASCE